MVKKWLQIRRLNKAAKNIRKGTYVYLQGTRVSWYGVYYLTFGNYVSVTLNDIGDINDYLKAVEYIVEALPKLRAISDANDAYEREVFTRVDKLVKNL